MNNVTVHYKRRNEKRFQDIEGQRPFSGIYSTPLMAIKGTFIKLEGDRLFVLVDDSEGPNELPLTFTNTLQVDDPDAIVNDFRYVKLTLVVEELN